MNAVIWALALIFLILTVTFVGGCLGGVTNPNLPPIAAPSQQPQTPQGYECTITDYGNNVILFHCSSLTEYTESFARSLSRYLMETNASVVGITAGANSWQSYIVVVKR